jgi:hypothetical protein
MSYVLTFPDDSERTEKDYETAIHAAIDILKQGMHETLQIMLRDLNIYQPNYHAYDDSGEFFINCHSKEFAETATKHQVLATIAFTPTREPEQRIIITKS